MLDINEVADITIVNTEGVLSLSVSDPYNSRTALITVEALQHIVDLINELNRQLKDLRNELRKSSHA
jgi:hypothetical protein